MSYSPILITNGEPNSVFLEIFFKSLKLNRTKSPIILISSIKLLKLQMKKLKYNYEIRLVDPKNIRKFKLDNKKINLVDVNFIQNQPFKKISSKSNKFINECFKTAFSILKEQKFTKFINGPISKKYFLKNKYLGITEYLSKKNLVKKSCMLIYNKKLSVCPLTTHLPLKLVPKQINKKLIYEKINLINSFYKKNFNLKPKIAITGLNPHCESILKLNEDKKILEPAIKNLKKKYFVEGPFSADTIFVSENRKKYDVIVGMYHDQVIGPLKTLFEYDAINITLGLPFVRISPDHGPNEKMMGKNLSDPTSLIKAIKFLDKN